MAELNTTNSDEQESHIAAILEYRYGDGMVYLPHNKPHELLSLARKNGYIDQEGYLTRKGRTLIARYHF